MTAIRRVSVLGALALIAVILSEAKDLLLAAALPPVAGAQQIRVESNLTLDRDTVRVGDPFRVFVSVRAPRGATIEFPTALDSSGTVQSIDPRAVFTQNDSTGFRQNAVYRVAAWDIGRQPIRLPDVTVRLGAASRAVSFPGHAIFVATVLPADSAQRIPKPARALFEHSLIPWWVWALIAAAALLLFGLWWWWRKRRRAQPEAVHIDPYVRAQRDFHRIDGLGLVEAGERSRYVALVVDVLREYIADRFTNAPLALTSTELLSATRQAATLPHDRLMRILNEADLVKFAKRPVSVDRARDIGQEARALVEHEHQKSLPVSAEADERAA
jgi:hypothetical protein